MIANYFKIGFRILTRQRSYTLLNIAGLSIGIAVFVFIYLYIQDEISYDRKWNEYERIYRVTNAYSLEGKSEAMALTPFLLAEKLKKDFPGIELSTKVFYTDPSDVNDISSVKYNDVLYEIPDITLGDENTFKIFNYKFLEGNPDTALKQPKSIVISKEIARSIFGNEKAVGKKLSTWVRDYTVTGVFDNKGYPSHLSFDAAISVSSLPAKSLEDLNKDWFWLSCYTYIKIADSVDIQQLANRINVYVDKTVDRYVDSAKVEMRGYYRFDFEPLSAVHFNTELDYDSPSNTDSANIVVFGIIALFILLTASINYVNLALARSLKRAKETGVRKVLGAFRKQLIMQHISESFIVTSIAFVFALSMVEFLMPQFNALVDKNLTLVGTLFSGEGLFFGLILIGMIIILAIMSGSFPALILSSFQPVHVLKGNNFFFSIKGKDWISTTGIRKLLVTLQYIVSIGMIVSTLIILSQMNYLDNLDLGFNKKNVVVINIPNDTITAKKVPDLVESIKKHTGVVDVCTSMNVPGYTEGKFLFSVGDSDTIGLQSFNYYAVGDNYFQTLDIELVDGSFFSDLTESDSTFEYIINEAAVDFLKLDKPVGTKMNSTMFSGKNGVIVGVVNNFNFKSLRNKVEPLIFLHWTNKNRYLLVRVDENQYDASFAHIKKSWYEQNEDRFMHYSMLEDKIKSLYRVDQKMLSLFFYFSIFVIFISSLGLYGLSSLLIEQRTKEIGIRKVLGGSETQILIMLSKSYLYLVLFAGFLITPVVYILMNRWLSTFAYSVGINAWFFIAGIFVALIIAFLTVYIRSFNVLRNSPSLALKYE